ncbi:MAG: hypothetical protein J6A04_00050 [Clostridia bacterium]|nr:hypothetical protein [Clostridia bacterium]
MIKDKKLAKNFIWNTIGSTLASFNSLFFLIAITRINGMQDAGIFTITFATASIFYIVAVYSGRNCQITDIKGKIKDKEYIISRICTCIIMAILVIIYAILNNYDSYKNSVLIFLCLWRATEAFSDVLYGIMQKNEKLYKVGISQIIKSTLGLIAFIIVDVQTHNLVYACITLCISSILTIIFYDFPQAINLISKDEPIQIKNVWDIYKKEFFLFANAFLTMYLLNAPKYAIEKYLTEDIQAVFGIILMPASILPLFAQFVVAPIINKLTQLYKQGNILQMRKIKKKSMYFIVGFGIIAMTLGYTIGIPILNFIYDVDLNPYRLHLVMILFAYIFYAMGYVETMILTIYRKIKEQFGVYVIVTITIFVSSYYLVGELGVMGASISCVISMILYYILLAIINKYETSKQKLISR